MRRFSHEVHSICKTALRPASENSVLAKFAFWAFSEVHLYRTLLLGDALSLKVC